MCPISFNQRIIFISIISFLTLLKICELLSTTDECNETASFTCGQYMCINRDLVCNGRQNCYNNAYDEDDCGKISKYNCLSTPSLMILPP